MKDHTKSRDTTLLARLSFLRNKYLTAGGGKQRKKVSDEYDTIIEILKKRGVPCNKKIW